MNRFKRYLFFMLLPVCGIMAIHILLTSIERYNYPAIAIIIMVCMTFSEKYPFSFVAKKDGLLGLMQLVINILNFDSPAETGCFPLI